MKKRYLFVAVLAALAIIIFVVGLFLIQSAQNKTPTELETVTLGAEASLLPAAVWVAENKGYFEDEGLDLKIKLYDSGKQSFNAMLDGNNGIDISTVAPTPIMFSSFKRQDFSIFASFAYSYEDVKVIARKDNGISTPSDLRGKKVGTPKGTTGQFVLYSFLIQNQINPLDVEVVDIAPSNLPAALKNNEVSAIVIWEPHAQTAIRELQDNALILPSSDLYKDTFNFTVMNDFAKNNPSVLKKFLRAIGRANEFIKNNKEESLLIASKRLGSNAEEMNSIWNMFIFELSLDQSLLTTLEDEARWAIAFRLVDAKEIPNYLNFIYFDALEGTMPQEVEIIR